MIDINLLPWRELTCLREKKQFKRNLLFSLLAALILVSFLVSGLGLLLFVEGKKIEAPLKKLNDQKKLFSLVKDEYQKAIELSQVVSRLNSEEKKRAQLINVMINVVAKRAIGVRIDSLFLGDDKITINALTNNEKSVHQYVDSLSKMPTLKNIKLSELVVSDGGNAFVIEGEMNDGIKK